MKVFLISLSVLTMLVIGGCCPCKTTADSRVNLSTNVGSDNLESNIITRPIFAAFSWLIGEGIDLTDVKVVRNADGFQEIQVKGYNRAFSTKRFDYRIEWFDANGMIVPSKTTVWQPMSVPSKSDFAIISIAPNKEVSDFKMNTRKSK